MPQGSTEIRHPASEGLHQLPGEQVLARLLDAQAEALGAVRASLADLDRAAEAGAQAIRSGGMMAYAGAGSSGLMALSDALELAGTFGIPPSQTPVLFAGGAGTLLAMTGAVEDDENSAEADVERAGLGAGDLLVAVSASGTTPYVLAAVRAAQARGAKVMGVANVAGSPLLRLAELPVLLDTGPELVAGSTRMGAGTAQKAALNMFSTLVGIRLGHVHDGYMVNVVADNAKLRDRARRMVQAISGRDEDTSARALDRTEGRVKPAVLIALGASEEEAENALRDSEGRLDAAIERCTNQITTTGRAP